MRVVTMAINAAASAFSNEEPRIATSPEILGNTAPRRRPPNYGRGGGNRWGRPVPHLALAALALCLLIGCSEELGTHGAAIRAGSRSALSAEACRAACAPHAWSLKLETRPSREHGCTCSGPGATEGGVSR